MLSTIIRKTSKSPLVPLAPLFAYWALSPFFSGGRATTISKGDLLTVLKDHQGDNSNDSSKRLVLLDVRSPGEFASGAIGSAINTPVELISQLKPGSNGMLDPDQWEELFPNVGLVPDPKDRVIVYCRAGARSAAAGSILKNLGFDDIEDYSGGTSEWFD